MRKIFLLTACCLSLSLPMRAQHRIVLSSKLDARAAQLLSSSRLEQSANIIHAYITLTDDAAKAQLEHQYSIRFNVRCGDTYTAVIPRSALSAVAADAHVKALYVGEQMKLMTDEVRKQIHADALQSGSGLSTSYTGKGVLIGVIDMGFDFTHPNFADATGRCRILNVWDQNAVVAPSGAYGYGSVYNSPAAIKAAAHDNTSATHGTHVAGIAAGSGITLYGGMAPEADLVLVSTNRTEQGIVDGVDYLLKYAKQTNRPIAINVSLGTIMGFKDGSGLMARMVDSLLAGQQGCLMSVAVGNEGNRNSTLIGRSVKSVWKVPAAGADQLFVETRPGDSCSVRLLLKDKNSSEVFFDHTFSTGKIWSERYDSFGSADKTRASLVASCIKNDVTGAYAISFHVGYSQQSSEEWSVEIESTNQRVFAYSNNGYFSAEGYEGYVDGTNSSTVAMTATGNEPIAVGATVSKNRYVSISGVETIKPWAISGRYPLSALGPCSDGRIKPDVVAPGASVVSSYNSFAAARTVKGADVVYRKTVGGKTFYWYVENGTSMAAPTVAGVMALWLQAKPTLTAAEVRTLLAKTSYYNSSMGQLPNNQYGMGQINALAGMRELLNTTSLSEIPTTASALYAYDAVTEMLSTQATRYIFVYSIDGQLLLQTSHQNLSLSGLPAGLYLVRLIGLQGEEIIKLRK